MNYTNISTRLSLPGDGQPSAGSGAEAGVLSLENNKRGRCLRVRKISTVVRRKLGVCKLTLAALALSVVPCAQQAAAQTYFIQPTTEATSKDAKIYNSTPTMNFQSNLDLTSPNIGAFFSSLIQFNLSSVPAGTTIRQATLTLYCRGIGVSGAPNPTGGTVTVQPITSGWSETAADAAVASAPPLATYNAVYGTTPTITLGNVVSSTVVNGAGFVTWDITSTAQQWHTGTLANNGVYLRLSTDNGDVGFDDVDTLTVAGSSPSLTLVVPEPSTNVALAIGGVGLLLACQGVRRRAASRRA